MNPPETPLRRTFGAPFMLGALGAVGLISALMGDDWRDWLSWAALASPLIVIVWARLRRRR